MAEFVQKKQKSEEGGVRSPKYPSTVVRVGVAAGDKVTKGTIVMTVEGMKMEVFTDTKNSCACSTGP